MSIIIKGMEMPKSCLYCPMLNGSDECCLLSDEQNYAYDDIDQVKDNYCPLAELPQKHGRLIDADKLLEAEEKDYIGSMIEAKKAGDPIRTAMLKTVHQAIEMFVNEQPAIVESEE